MVVCWCALCLTCFVSVACVWFACCLSRVVLLFVVFDCVDSVSLFGVCV